MIDYGVVNSTVRPAERIVDDQSVWINTDMQPVERTDMEGGTFTGYSYHQVRYSKDAYLQKLEADNADLGRQVTNLQLALTDLYEGTVE